MRDSLVQADNYTFPIVNRAISLLGGEYLKCGEMVHCIAIQMGFGENLYFSNTLIEMYAKNGIIDAAFRVFDEMPDRDLVSWTSMISGYVSNGDVISSFRIFHKMRMENLEPNLVTLLIMFGACSVDRNVVQGRKLHGYVIKNGMESDGSLKNSMLTMYSKCGTFQDVEILFNTILRRDVVTWNIMISTYSLYDNSSRVAEILYEMQTEVIPSVETLTLAISSFAKSGHFLQGEKVHAYVVKTGVFDNILQSSLVEFYAKCGEIGKALQCFKEGPRRNYITWGAMMSGFLQNGYIKEAIEMFCQIQDAGMKPGSDVLRNLVLAYSHLGALRLGKVAHGYVIRNIICRCAEDKLAMETSILNMYAKCGSIVSARRCFDQIAIKDVVLWSSMIEAYNNHGLGFEALQLFDCMVDEGVEPNSITILSILSACNHSGLVSEACMVFEYMGGRFGIKPDLNHYTCMVDLLGRSGELCKAREMIENMVIEPDSRIWGSLLAASKIHFNRELGTYASERLMKLDLDTAEYHTLISNVHVSSERWVEAENVRKVMGAKNFKKPPGWSCIEARGKLHGFVASDVSHPKMPEIHGILQCLNRNAMEEFG
ncbi:Pentatricopeptide repeat-containing protein [Thalictrum thalictroides]|uniref:Pentatricopeptide repeat-containing protein n=1 Tax=Thalictrum thalictroides TaxID=46969 RepID=A0A7J6WFD9_THATH|nr:Pentatricopeptide repeat-containing protein [Thalictrum thalictroides]